MKTHKNITSIIGSLMILVTITFNHQTIFAQKYYPLAIGNRWDYVTNSMEYTNSTMITDTYYYSVRVLGDTTMSNGIKYFIVNDGTIVGLNKTAYLRADTNWIYAYYPNYSKEVGYYKLDANVDDAWKPFQDKLTLNLSNIYQEIIVGIPTKILCFCVYAPSTPFRVYLSDNFGPIGYYYQHGAPYTSISETKLIGCLLSGIYYGYPMDLDNNQTSPNEFIVFQNTPNPFSSSTTISWQQNQTSVTKVIIYNSLGQKVRTLLNDQIDVGKHSLVWDGKNDAGQLLRSGIYFYEIIQSSNRVVKQMVMIK